MYIKRSYFRKLLTSLSWRFFNYLENNNNWDIQKNGEKKFIENFLKNLKKSQNEKAIVFDVGANQGNWSEMILSLASRYNVFLEIHAFEPAKQTFNILQSKFINHRNMILNNTGLSTENTTAEIFYDSFASGLASLYRRKLNHYNINFDKSEQILLIRAEDYIEGRGINHINLVKIDVEGHELKVLLGFGKFLNENFIDYIQFEYGGANLDSHTSLLEIYDFLESRGFVIGKIFPKGVEIRKYNPYMENFMYSNYVAVSKRLVK